VYFAISLRCNYRTTSLFPTWRKSVANANATNRTNLRHLRNPEPDSLEDVSWNLLGPLAVLSVKSCLTGSDIGITTLDDRRSFEDLPEAVENEENRYANVGGKEVYGMLVF